MNYYLHIKNNYNNFSHDCRIIADDYPMIKMGWKLSIEAIKVVASTAFLHIIYKNCFEKAVKNPQLIQYIIVQASCYEEILFRGIFLTSIYFIQEKLNCLGEKASSKHVKIKNEPRLFTLQFTNLPQNQSLNSNVHVIKVHIPLIEKLIYEVVLGVFNYLKSSWSRLTHNAKFCFYLSYNVFPQIHSTSKPKSYSVMIPILMEQEIFWKGLTSSIYFFQRKWQQLKGNELEENNQISKIFRIYVSALIFASVHFLHHYQNPLDTLKQFSITLISGIIWGNLCEKYQTLSLGILSHGFNNLLAIGRQNILKNHLKFATTAAIVNLIGAYALT